MLTESMNWHKDAEDKKKLLVLPYIKDNTILLVNKNSILTQEEFEERTKEYIYKNDPNKRDYVIKRWFLRMPESNLADFPSTRKTDAEIKRWLNRALSKEGWTVTIVDKKNKRFEMQSKSEEAQNLLKNLEKTKKAKDLTETELYNAERERSCLIGFALKGKGIQLPEMTAEQMLHQLTLIQSRIDDLRIARQKWLDAYNEKTKQEGGKKAEKSSKQ